MIVNEWAWLCPNKTLFIKIIRGPDLARQLYVVCQLLLYNNKNEQIETTLNNMSESWKHMVKWEKPDTEENALYGSVCIRFKTRHDLWWSGSGQWCPWSGEWLEGPRGTSGVLVRCCSLIRVWVTWWCSVQFVKIKPHACDLFVLLRKVTLLWSTKFTL